MTSFARTRQADLVGKKLFDSGCGTGAFLQRMLDLGVGELHAYDPSPAMMEKVRAKFEKMTKEDAARVHLYSGRSPPAFPAESFDFVTSLQVVQNLTPDNPEAFASARAAYQMELNRILKPGGMCVITTRYRLQNGPSTYGDMYWYADKAVTPKAVDFMELAVPQDPAKELAATGFADCRLFNSPDLMINEIAYHDSSKNHILDSAFRAADSFFSRLDTQELAALTAHVQDLLEAGKLQEYIAERSKIRGSVGQVAICVGSKIQY